MIDLHCHSQYSDGLLSPSDLLDRAIHAGVSMLALTDHDSIAGIADLHLASQQKDITVIPGIELSVRWKKYDIHVLGLRLDPTAPELLAIIAQQNDARIMRAKVIGELLARFGIDDAYEKACNIAGHIRIGRAHYAQLLVSEGLVQDVKTAFTRYLGQGKVAYAPSSWINLSEAVAAIHAAGGDAVIAHPLKYRLTRTKLHELIRDFKEVGGEAIEVVSGNMLEQDIQMLANLCIKFEVLASSGSDFHGDGLSRVGVGRQKQLPKDCVSLWSTW